MSKFVFKNASLWWLIGILWLFYIVGEKIIQSRASFYCIDLGTRYDLIILFPALVILSFYGFYLEWKNEKKDDKNQ